MLARVVAGHAPNPPPEGQPKVGKDMFGIYVQDNGNVHFVGDRDSRKAAEESAAIYNADPIQQGFFYVIEKRAIRRMAQERADALAALDA